ncbi:hypothetical protein EJB05_50117, partial [Eragrostis curvula]
MYPNFTRRIRFTTITAPLFWTRPAHDGGIPLICIEATRNAIQTDIAAAGPRHVLTENALFERTTEMKIKNLKALSSSTQVEAILYEHVGGAGTDRVLKGSLMTRKAQEGALGWT